MASPNDVAVSSVNDAYVTTSCSVQKIFANTNVPVNYVGTGSCGMNILDTLPVISSNNPLQYALNNPTFITIDNSDNIFFIDSGNNRIVGVTNNGAVTTTYVVQVSVPIQNILQVPSDGVYTGITTELSTNTIFFAYNSKTPFGANTVYSFIPGNLR